MSDQIALFNLKLRVARAQLGTALGLFLRDCDPFSVHALACGGSELIEGLAQQQGVKTFSTHILETFPDTNVRKIRSLKNMRWNAIKHFYEPDFKTPRDDSTLLGAFADEKNDDILFIGWQDYLFLTQKLPVEVQVFQIWWFALNEEKLNPGTDIYPFRKMFPNITNANRAEQKRRLKRAVEKYSNSKDIQKDPRTETGPLIPRNKTP